MAQNMTVMLHASSCRRVVAVLVRIWVSIAFVNAYTCLQLGQA